MPPCSGSENMPSNAFCPYGVAHDLREAHRLGPEWLARVQFHVLCPTHIWTQAARRPEDGHRGEQGGCACQGRLAERGRAGELVVFRTEGGALREQFLLPDTHVRECFTDVSGRYMEKPSQMKSVLSFFE